MNKAYGFIAGLILAAGCSSEVPCLYKHISKDKEVIELFRAESIPEEVYQQQREIIASSKFDEKKKQIMLDRLEKSKDKSQYATFTILRNPEGDIHEYELCDGIDTIIFRDFKEDGYILDGKDDFPDKILKNGEEILIADSDKENIKDLLDKAFLPQTARIKEYIRAFKGK